MKKIALILLLSSSFLVTPVFAKTSDVDAVVSGCQVDPGSCVAQVNAYYLSLDAINDNVGAALSRLAAGLYSEAGILDAEDLADYSDGLRKIAELLVPGDDNFAARILEMADRVDNGLGGRQGRGGGRDASPA